MRPACPNLETPQWICASNGQTYRSECEMYAVNHCSYEKVYLVKRERCHQYHTSKKIILKKSF